MSAEQVTRGAAQPRVVIGPGVLRGQPGRFREILLSAGFDLVEPPGADILSPDVVREVIANADAMLAGGEGLPTDLFESAPLLRVLARVGVGYDQVNLEAATRHGVVVTITPGTNHESVAEHTFALMLAVTRRVAQDDALIRRNQWLRTVLQPLRGRTLGLAGFGRIGRAVAQRALAFGMTVCVQDPFLDPADAEKSGVTLVDRDALIARSDIISLHLPLDATTRGSWDQSCFGRMKPGAILINTARGGLINESHLYDALASGRLAGAGLDVLVDEPPPHDHPLLTLPQVVFTPHVAGVDERSLADMAALAAQCVVDLHQGRWPGPCIVNPKLQLGWSWNRS